MNKDIQELENILNKNISKTDATNKIPNNGDISLAFDSLTWYVERKTKYGMLGDKTRFPTIHKITEGYIPGSVYTIGAYSNVGKSRFMYGEVNHALELGKKVMVFSLEEMKGIVLRNLICQRNEIRPDELFGNEEIKEAFLDQFENLLLYDNIFNIKGIEMEVMKHKPDYVFIDFIQNVQIDINGGNYEKMSHIAKNTQRIAIQNKCVLVQLSQVSNDVGKQLSKGDTDFISLKGAGELFASSDVIFILYKGEMDTFRLHIAKNKYGRAKDSFIFDVDWEISKFTLEGDY